MMPRKLLSSLAITPFLLLGCAQQPVETTSPMAADAATSYDAATVQQLKAQAQPVELSSENPEKDRIVCTRETSVSSVIPRRVCRRSSEIQEQARRTQGWMDDEMFGDGYVRDSVLPR